MARTKAFDDLNVCERTKLNRKLRNGDLSPIQVATIAKNSPDDFGGAYLIIAERIFTPWAWAKTCMVARDLAIAGDAAARQFMARYVLPEGRRSKGHAARRALEILTDASQELKLTLRKSSQEIELSKGQSTLAQEQSDRNGADNPSP
jgi:hypothetical protein